MVVLGMIERGGSVLTRVVEDRRSGSVVPSILQHVRPGAWVATDEAGAFARLEEFGYEHETVNHARKEYVRGPIHTNSIESFWATIKRGIYGTHVWVSKKHLSSYLGEFEFRHNLRKRPELMYEHLLQAFPRP